jgi:flavin-dependent dehydrogenase
MLLARRGYRVLLLDKGSFPSDTMSGHYIHQPGVACLERWGLREAVAATNCPPITSIRFDVGPFALEGTPPPSDGIAEGYCCRRYLLDQVLVDAAVAAGAELRERVTVEDLVWEDGRVTGARTSAGIEHARIVVGADGIHSRVAKLTGAAIYDTFPPISCGYYSYWEDIDHGGIVRLMPRGDRFLGAAPTNDGRTFVFYQGPIADFPVMRSDVEGQYMAAMSRDPWLADQLARARRVERFTGTADLPNFFRKPYGPGWALVGDAGYHKDPITAQGLTNAFEHAEMLADSIDAGLAGRRPMDEALAGYEAARNQQVGPMYHFTMDVARCEPPSAQMQELLGALIGNQEGINAFLGLIAGTTGIPQFFSEENMARLMATPAGAL